MEKVPEEVPEVEFRKKNGIVGVLASALMTQTIQVRECNYTLQILTAPHGNQQGSICHDKHVAYRPLIANWRPHCCSFLIFQASDRNHKYTIFSSISVIACSCEYHHEGWFIHFFSIYFACKSYQVCSTLIDEFVAT